MLTVGKQRSWNLFEQTYSKQNGAPATHDKECVDVFITRVLETCRTVVDPDLHMLRHGHDQPARMQVCYRDFNIQQQRRI